MATSAPPGDLPAAAMDGVSPCERSDGGQGLPPSLKLRRTAEALAEAGQPLAICDVACVSLVARIERLLDAGLAAADDRSLEESARRISALGRELAEELALEALALRASTSPSERAEVIGRIRVLVRE